MNTASIPAPRNVPHMESERFDKITIEIVERWKESHLSGDEWRFNAAVTFWKKGVEVHVQTFRNVGEAAQCLPALLLGVGLTEYDWQRAEAAQFGKCDQPGCCNDAKYIHRLKERYTRDGTKYAVSAGGDYRKFCERHKHRGDCALEDADRNYTVEEIDL